jgi:hypothetical protein
VSHSLNRKLAAAGAVSAILLALTRIGVTPVAPGLNTGFKPVMPCKAGALCMEMDVGNQHVLVKMRFAATSTFPSGWRADLSNGTQLGIHQETAPGGGPVLVLTHADSTAALAKFSWPSGVALRVWHDKARLPDLKSWRVIPEKEGYDSTGRARWRRFWFIVSLAFLGVGVWAAALEALGKAPVSAPPPPPPLPPPSRTVRELSDELVRLTISGISVDGPDNTALVQRLLTEILLGTLTVRVAMEQVAPGSTPARQQQLFHRARAQFREQWKKVIEILTEHGKQLN